MERISTLLPTGGGDLDVHHGARRASRRYPLAADVELLEPKPATGFAINASAGGLRIAIDETLPVGELVVIVIRTESREMTEHARVVWVKDQPDGALIGLEFVSVS